MTRFNQLKNVPIVQKGTLKKIKKRGATGMCVLLLLLFALPVHAQKEAANWYFGDHAGLDFNSGTPIALTDGQLVQQEGCATISDSNGNLLFYTDGKKIYNANQLLMQNGSGLLGHSSSTQSAIIVPYPGNNDRYYVFTVGAQAGFLSNGILAYSIVDMNLDGGLGGIITNEKNIQLDSPVAEKITAVYHENGQDIWVIAHRMGNNDFIAYLISSAGINTSPVVSSIGTIHVAGGTGSGAIGYLKASPDGTMLACATGYFNRGLEVLDFNTATGAISNAQQLNTYPIYGVEFSPNSQLVYCSKSAADMGPILQYDLTQPTLADIQASETIIASDYEYSALQLGIDGKIYAAQYEKNSLAVISNPNALGSACNVVDDAVDLGGEYSRLGLPAFIQSYFQYEIVHTNGCFSEEIAFEVKTFGNLPNVSWDFGDPSSGTENTAIGTTTAHVFSAPGTYTVTVNLTTIVNTPITLTREVTIYPSPQLHEPNDLVQCGEPIFDLTQTIPEVLGAEQNIDDFTITYYKNQSDADAGIPGTEITDPETYVIETIPQQEIYVRVENEFGCYNTVSFKIRVNSKPVVDLSTYDGMAICVDLDPDTPVIGGNYSPIVIDTELSETEYIFQWTLDGNTLLETGSNILVSVPGEYAVTVTDITSTDPSCTTTASATIIQSNPPEFEVRVTDFEDEIMITNITGNGNYEFSVNENYWKELGEKETLVFTDIDFGSHKIYGRDKNGCGMTIIDFWMIDYMKFFTPNSDGRNDRWNVLGLENQPGANLYIFDRYGKLLAEINPAGLGWDGTYNGKRMPSNDYWFRLEYVSSQGTPKVFQANFTLKR